MAVDETAGSAGPSPPSYPCRATTITRASSWTLSQRYQRGVSGRMSAPTSRAKRRSGCFSTRCSRVRAVRPQSGSSRSASSAVQTWAPRRWATASSHIRTRSSQGASALPKGWRQVGSSQTSRTPCVASAHQAAMAWATCGGLKEPPSRAISGRGSTSAMIGEERGAPPGEGPLLGWPGRGEVAQRGPRLDALSLPCRAAEQVEGRHALDELVGLAAPGEALRRQRPGVEHAGQAGPDRAEGLLVEDVELDAVAADPGVLVPGRREAGGPE